MLSWSCLHYTIVAFLHHCFWRFISALACTHQLLLQCWRPWWCYVSFLFNFMKLGFKIIFFLLHLEYIALLFCEACWSWNQVHYTSCHAFYILIHLLWSFSKFGRKLLCLLYLPPSVLLQGSLEPSLQHSEFVIPLEVFSFESFYFFT